MNELQLTGKEDFRELNASTALNGHGHLLPLPLHINLRRPPYWRLVLWAFFLGFPPRRLELISLSQASVAIISRGHRTVRR